MGARIRGVAVVVLVLVTGAVLGSWISEWLRAPGVTTTPVQVPIPSVFGERVRVEVRNGGGRAGMARAATDILREGGFDVVELGNWSTFDEAESFVVTRAGGGEASLEVARTLGIGIVRDEPDPNLRVDVTVVLGRDWSPERAPVPDQSSPARPWWDLRQYLERPGRPDEGSRLADPENGM